MGVEETETEVHKRVLAWLTVLSCVASPLLRNYESHREFNIYRRFERLSIVC